METLLLATLSFMPVSDAPCTEQPILVTPKVLEASAKGKECPEDGWTFPKTTLISQTPGNSAQHMGIPVPLPPEAVNIHIHHPEKEEPGMA